MLQVVKADGSSEPFSEEKLKQSITRAGIPQDLQARILQSVKDKIYDGIPTYDIYGLISDSLAHSHEPFSKARYSLKQAIMLLGPTGYPFEDFVGRVLEEQGYTVQTRQVLMGKCVSHEIDVIAQKDKEMIMVEAKYHNNPGTRSEVQVALYVKARFDDVKEKHGFTQAWVVTNTKATVDAHAYAACADMKIISWDKPEGESLRELIEAHHLHPVTMLTTLSVKQKAQLLANHVVLCKDISDDPLLLDKISLEHEEKVNTLNEIKYIVKTDHA